MTAETIFQSIKKEILSLIRNNTQITASTPHGISGIYLLYVDEFSGDKVLPIYIGKTTDFKSRLRQHVNDISKLNNIPYHTYYNHFLWGAKQYDGHFKACKIFKYMVEHQCSLQDLKMVILEECDKDSLSEREQVYLSKYLPAFFGFNQINSISEFWTSKTEPQKYAALQKADGELFNTFIDFGFSKFNYLHAFSGSPYNVYRNYLDKETNKAYYWDNTTRAENITRLGTLFRRYTDVFEQAKTSMSILFASPIHEIFEQCKLKSAGREQEVLALLLNNSDTREVSDVIEIREYLEYYMHRDKNSRKCGQMLQALFAAHLGEIKKINSPVTSAFADYINCRKEIFSHSRFSLVFPDCVYSNYPLTM